jgi:hypothetical protein
MNNKIEIILLETEAEYQQEYIKVFVNGSFAIWGIPVLFDEKSFEHIFFEPENDTAKKTRFSKRRAKKMYFIKAMLDGDVLVEVMFEPDRGTFALFCIDLDCVMYLRNRVGTGKLQIGSFFDFGKDHTKMYEKQKRKCLPILESDFKAMVK